MRWACRPWPRRRRMKVKRKRSYRSIWIWWNSPDVKKNQHLFSLKISHSSALKSLENRFTNMHQSMPDLSFFASTEGRLAGGGEAGGGAWGRGCREEESLPSFLNKCQNSTGQSAATQESPKMSHAIQAKYQIRFIKTHLTDPSQHAPCTAGILLGHESGYETAGTNVSGYEWLKKQLGHAASARTFQSATLFRSGDVRVLTCLFSGPKRGVWWGGEAERVEGERGTEWDTEHCCPTLLSWNT